MPMLYRSPLTRLILVAAGLFAGLMLTVGGDRWRSTPSLHWLAQARIPLRIWGLVIIVYAVLLVWQRTRPGGYALGAVLCAVFTISLWATVADGGPANAVVLAGMIDVTAFHAFSVRTAWAQKLASP